ncbi:MAG TPA: ammosamide/lymphostin RiPP family protein [Ktedonobacteraceae bacterium]
MEKPVTSTTPSHAQQAPEPAASAPAQQPAPVAQSGAVPTALVAPGVVPATGEQSTAAAAQPTATPTTPATPAAGQTAPAPATQAPAAPAAPAAPGTPAAGQGSPGNPAPAAQEQVVFDELEEIEFLLDEIEDQIAPLALQAPLR